MSNPNVATIRAPTLSDHFPAKGPTNALTTDMGIIKNELLMV